MKLQCVFDKFYKKAISIWFCYEVKQLQMYIFNLEWFQMKTHGVKKCSSTNKVLAHTIKCHLEHISFKKSFGKGLRKAKNCKIIAQK